MRPEDYRQALAVAMTEAELLAQVLGTPKAPGLARVLGWIGYHTHRSDRSEPGFPDLVLVRAPRLIFAELKTEKGRTTAPQDTWLSELGDVHDASEAVRQASVRPGRHAVPEVYLWRPYDLLDGTIAATLAREPH